MNRRKKKRGMKIFTNRCSFVSTLTLLQYFLNALSILSGDAFSSSVNPSANVPMVFIQTK
jgi:hypothetical protein